MPIARRFALPLLLLVGCVASFVMADRLGNPARDVAEPEPIPTLSVPLASIRRLPELATEPLNAIAVQDALPVPPAGVTSLSCLTIMIDGRIAHEVRGDTALVPGYAQLLLTGHVALDLLGPDYRYLTTVVAEALPDADGVVNGNLYLVGGGDPVLMTFNYSRGFRPILSTRTSIEELADRVLDAGVAQVTGGVVGVERRYDTVRSLPGWPSSYTEAGLVGPLSALQLDDGFQERAAANGGVAVPSDEPARLAAERFDDLLEDSQVSIAGIASFIGEGDELPELVPIATLESAPLRDIIFQMFAVNDASAAEMVLKELGFVDSRRGSTQSGGEAVVRVLSEQGVPIDIAPRDGSGLDPVSTLTCRQLAAVADTISDDHPTLDVLPSYDLPGVFGGEFADIDLSADLRLVGGSIGDSSGLVARTVDDGSRVVIAAIVNRAGGTRITDIRFLRDAVASVDALRVSLDARRIEVAPQGAS